MAKLHTPSLAQNLIESMEADNISRMNYFIETMQSLSDRTEALQEARDARCTCINKTRDALVNTINETFAGFRSTTMVMYDEIITDTQSMLDKARKQLDLITEDEPLARLTPENLRVVDDAA